MTDAEILATMRAKKAEAEQLNAKADALEKERAVIDGQMNTLWHEIRRLHNALLVPDPAL